MPDRAAELYFMAAGAAYQANRVDLATAFAAIGEREETQHHVDHAATLAADIGSVRQRRRLQTLNQLRW